MLPGLYSKRVINDDEKEAIQNKRLKKDKVSFLFDEVIKPQLKTGVSTKFDSMVEVMDASDDSTAWRLSEKLQGTIIATYVHVWNWTHM